MPIEPSTHLSTTAKVLFLALAAFFGGWSVSALTGNSMIHSSWALLGVSPTLADVIAALELTGAVAVLAGLRWPVVGAAGAFGLVCMMTGAITFHVRAGHTWEAHGAGVLLLVSMGAFIAAAPTVARRARVSAATTNDPLSGQRQVILTWKTARLPELPAVAPMPLKHIELGDATPIYAAASRR